MLQSTRTAPMKALRSLCTLCCLLLASCTSQRLESESGLYNVPMTHSYKVPADGYWSWGKGNPYAHKTSGTMYIAPLDVSRVQEDYPELAPQLVEQMHALMVEDMGAMLTDANAANHTRWVLTEDAAAADIRIDLAVVGLRTQKPGLHVIAKAISRFTPTGVSDTIDFISKGDITLEGTIRDNRSGLLIFAFKDSNRAKLRFYHKDTYRRTGHVDANLRLWARRLAALCRECAYDRMGEHTLREKIENSTFADAVKARLSN